MSGESILYLSPAFLSYRRHKLIRGVQVFDLLVIRQLVEMGYEVTVAAERTWRERFEDRFEGVAPEIVYTPSLRRPWLNGPAVEMLLRGRRFDALIVGNDTRGLLPTVKRLIRRGVADRRVMIANRMPRPDFLSRVRGVEIDVVAVNTQIAAAFEGVVEGHVQTRYGVVNADEFYPAEKTEASDKPVRFCLLGKLDNDWKGADEAIEAFGKLPHRVRESAELHLIAYPVERRFEEKNIRGYGWIDAERVPSLVRTMDVMLVLSKGDYETFCQTMVQGMLSGLPIVSTPLPVLVEKLDQGGGVIVHNEDQLIEAMATLATDPSLRSRLGGEARATALSRYVWSTRDFVDEVLLPPRAEVSLSKLPGGVMRAVSESESKP